MRKWYTWATVCITSAAWRHSFMRRRSLGDLMEMRWKSKVYFRPNMVTVALLFIFTLFPSLTVAVNDYLIRPQVPLGDRKPLHGSHDFSLRHIFHHGTYKYPQLHKRLDIKPDATVWIASEDGEGKEIVPHLRASSRPVQIQRLADRRVSVIEDHLATARAMGFATTLSPAAWNIDELPGPDISDKETVLSIANMAANAYIMEPGTEDWSEVSGPFNHSQKFGWEKDGLRGHIYADDSNSTIVIALKGTSTALFDGEETTTNDKVNDNLFFSCCCGQGGQYFWRQVCDCYSGTYSCNSTCLVGALRNENRYYRAALDLYANVTDIYPKSDVWLTGHSLGGSVTSLLGMTYGLPAITFEAVPDALPASRLGLPTPPGSDPYAPQSRSYSGTYHFGHTADPVYMGSCNGAASVCTLAGYAMESSCHTGQRCVYDTVEDLGWRVGIGTHRIRSVISDVLEKYDTVPDCARDELCVDCHNWKFFESNGSDPTTTTTSTTSHVRTRTSTCETPGWWGCLDKTTTTDTSTTSPTTSTTTTSTCKTPGWFGCKDPTTTSSIETPAPSPPLTSLPEPTSSTSSSSTSCEHPGWFGGCNDPTSTTTSPESSGPSTYSHSCETPGLFWGCRDSSTSDSVAFPITSPPSTTTASP